ncbi:MAG: RHS repeat-associated core domain-containing protein [Alphaproteobacteria bacterium]
MYDGSFGHSENNVFYVASDQLGASRTITNDTGSQVWSWLHAPFGDSPAISTTNRGELVSTDLRFPGMVSDEESGLFHNGPRDYNSALGVYNEFDPLGLAAGVNGFRYVGSNPVNAIDPSGLDTYIVNRNFAILPWNTSDPRWDYFSHTFVVVTNPNGSIAHTYSWGDDANLTGWSIDQPLDNNAAQQALNNGRAEWVAGSPLDPYIGQAFNVLNNPAFNHANGWIINSCKTEANNLIYNAWYLYEQDRTRRAMIP